MYSGFASTDGVSQLFTSVYEFTQLVDKQVFAVLGNACMHINRIFCDLQLSPEQDIPASIISGLRKYEIEPTYVPGKERLVESMNTIHRKTL